MRRYLIILLLVAIAMSISPFVAISKTLEHEGGWSNHKADKGGKTNYGITLATLQSFEPHATEATLRNMTKEDAVRFYEKYFFYGMGVDKFPDKVQDKIFDMNVNHGLRNSIRIVQRALAALGFKIEVDGIPGPKTVEMAKKANPDQLRAELVHQRLNFYRRIIEKHPDQRIFWKGWEKRAKSFA